MKTIEIEGKQYAVSGYADDGLPIIKAKATSVHEVDEHGNLKFDEHGNPTKSVIINVPSTLIGATPGKVQ